MKERFVVDVVGEEKPTPGLSSQKSFPADFVVNSEEQRGNEPQWTISDQNTSFVLNRIIIILIIMIRITATTIVFSLMESGRMRGTVKEVCKSLAKDKEGILDRVSLSLLYHHASTGREAWWLCCLRAREAWPPSTPPSAPSPPACCPLPPWSPLHFFLSYLYFDRRELGSLHEWYDNKEQVVLSICV